MRASAAVDHRREPTERPWPGRGTGVSLSARASAGRPSTRSPMMLPWIWSEPPAMRSDGECRNLVVHTPPRGRSVGVGEHAGGALHVDGRGGHLLHEAGVGQLHHRRLGARAGALGQRGLRPQPQVAQQLAAQVGVDHRLAHQRVVGHARAAGPARSARAGRRRRSRRRWRCARWRGWSGRPATPPPPRRPRWPAGMRTSSRNTSLKWASPVIWRSGRMSMPGRAPCRRRK